MKKRPEYIVVGRFGRPRGTSGEIYVNPLTDNPERFKGNETLWIESEDGWKKIKVLSVRFISGRPALRIEASETPEDAKRFTNQYLYIKADELDQLPEGSYYHFDLIGCRVTDTEGKQLGEIVNIESYPANDAWVIETGEGKRILFPAVKKFIVEVDIEKNLVVINPPEGIFDSPDED